LIEDSYGPAFIDKLIKKLKENGFIKTNEQITCDKFTINKLAAMIKVQKIQKNRIIVIVDCDGKCENGNGKRIIDICIDNKMDDRCIIKLAYEIEEWICTIDGLDYRKEKPSKVLKHKLKYEKYRLPDYANNIANKVQELMTKSDSFHQFIECLK